MPAGPQPCIPVVENAKTYLLCQETNGRSPSTGSCERKRYGQNVVGHLAGELGECNFLEVQCAVKLDDCRQGQEIEGDSQCQNRYHGSGLWNLNQASNLIPGGKNGSSEGQGDTREERKSLAILLFRRFFSFA